MSLSDFWSNSDPSLFYAYKKAYNNEVDVKREEINFQSWLQGSYIQSAISDLLREKNTEPSYPTSPIDFKEIIRRNLLTDEEKQNEDYQKMVEYEELMRVENINKLKRVLEGKEGD